MFTIDRKAETSITMHEIRIYSSGTASSQPHECSATWFTYAFNAETATRL